MNDSANKIDPRTDSLADFCYWPSDCRPVPKEHPHPATALMLKTRNQRRPQAPPSLVLGMVLSLCSFYHFQVSANTDVSIKVAAASRGGTPGEPYIYSVITEFESCWGGDVVFLAVSFLSHVMHVRSCTKVSCESM